jgi:SAM-dependent methyltransferase
VSQPYSSLYDRSIHSSWLLYAAVTRLLRGRAASPEFARQGYVRGVLSPRVQDATVRSLDGAEFMRLEVDDYLPGFRRSEKVRKVGATLNAGHRYYRLGPAQLATLSTILLELREPFASAIGSPWRVLNLRVLQTLSSAAMMGPNTWHGDGFPPQILKAMVYLTAADRRSGTTEFQREDGSTFAMEGPPGTWVLFRNSRLIHRGIPPAENYRTAVEITLSPALTFALRPLVGGLNATYPEYPWSLNAGARTVSDFLGGWMRPRVSVKRTGGKSRVAISTRPAREKKVKPSKLEAGGVVDAQTRAERKSAKAAHARAKGDKARRKAAAVERKAAKAAHARAKVDKARRKMAAVVRHQGGTRWQRALRTVQLRSLLMLNRVLPPSALNVGGGPTFAHARWLNLEGAAGIANPRPFHLSPSCTFPVRDRAVSTVYTSHCIEHLDDDTVARVMSEARRVIRANGRLVVKIPDFEMVVDRWRARDETYFTDDQWGYRRLTRTWASRGVRDTLDYRAAMIFCGVWNAAYGDHFSGSRGEGTTAYHGPVPVSEDVLLRLRDERSPHVIAQALRSAALQVSEQWSFNHQNAWSRTELAGVLETAGFEVTTFEPDAVIAAAGDIPGITTARSESLYCLAVPR